VRRRRPPPDQRPGSDLQQGGIAGDARAEKALVQLLLAPLGKCAPVAVLGLVSWVGDEEGLAALVQGRRGGRQLLLRSSTCA